MNKYAQGNKKENAFCLKIAPRLGISASTNKQKMYDPYVPDLVIDGAMAELKTQSTPFFSSQKYCGIDPQWEFSFPRNAYLRYKKNYPNIDIYFWVKYTQKTCAKELGGFVHGVKQMEGVWKANFSEVEKIIESGSAPLFHHKDPKNGDSYALDLRLFRELYLKIKAPKAV